MVMVFAGVWKALVNGEWNLYNETKPFADYENDRRAYTDKIARYFSESAL